MGATNNVHGAVKTAALNVWSCRHLLPTVSRRERAVMAALATTPRPVERVQRGVGESENKY